MLLEKTNFLFPENPIVDIQKSLKMFFKEVRWEDFVLSDYFLLLFTWTKAGGNCAQYISGYKFSSRRKRRDNKPVILKGQTVRSFYAILQTYN
jgi:hypothetical protein